MKNRRVKIIKDKKERGEWAESVFMARVSEEGLPVCKPWGDSRSFDCVVGRPGKFLGVQVKCTIAKLENGKGYICSTCSSHKAYRPGAFDYLAAYVIPEDAWYIIPAKEIRGLKSISLCTGDSEGKYERYREAWHLLREAVGVEAEEPALAESSAANVEPTAQAMTAPEAAAPRFPGNAFERMQAAADFCRRAMERGAAGPRKPGESV